jgi:PAS domain S-box-containing protein
MFKVRNYSISQKLTWMNMLVSGAALLLACAAFAAYELEDFRATMVRSLSIQAQIVGANSASALLFNDPATARTNLSALDAAPHIRAAGIYTPEGQLFASWVQDPGDNLSAAAVPAGQTEFSRFTSNELILVRVIEFQGKRIGVVQIDSDLGEVRDRLVRYGGIVAVVLIMSLMAALIFSTIFQRTTARPIAQLAETARIVSREKKYSVRAPSPETQDEIAALIDAFNEMLEQIQERDSALESAIGALRQSEERYRLVSEISSDYVYSLKVNPDGTLVCEWITDPFTRITGYTPEEINSRGWSSLYHSGDLAVARQHYETLLAGNADTVEVRVVAKNERVRWIRIYERPIGGAGKIERIYGAAQDITIQRQLEEQLLQTGKMEAIGQLAGGVAHDFNNLLTVIRGYGDLLQKQPDLTDASRDQIAEILEAARRASEMTRQLLAFGRGQVLQLRNVNLNRVVEGIESLLRRLIGEDLELKVIRAQGLGLVKADPGQIEQVIMNLVVNARDAMATGDRLTIETANADMQEDEAGQHGIVPAGHYVMLSVSDTGAGMDQETVARAFEPFFTTKEPGQGTGLGLAMVYGIVKQSGGDIRVFTEPGHGTTFKLYFPRLESGEETARESAPFSLRPAGSGTETILVLEDETAVRELVRQVLVRLGYTVLDTGDPAEAIAICKQRGDAIDLLITDVIMPGMSGPQVVEQVIRLHPEIRILYTSGYTAKALIEHGMGQHVSFFAKPFSPEALASKVREVLDASQDGDEGEEYREDPV